MKQDVLLLGIVALIWLFLSVLYFTVPMIQMPMAGRVWGLGGLLFLVWTVIIATVWLRSRGSARRTTGTEDQD